MSLARYVPGLPQASVRVTAPAAQAGLAAGARAPRGAPATGPVAQAGPKTAWRMRAAALPLVDLAALTVAAVVAGEIGWPAAGYAAVVLVALAASGLHRLRICLRVCDQAGRIAAAAAAPALLLLPWVPAGTALRLAAWAIGLLIVFRLAGSAALRAAHRRGMLTEQALLVGAGETGSQLADLIREHPELGLRPRGFLDSSEADSRRPLMLPVLGRVTDLGAVVTRLGISRVIVSFPDGRDEDMVPVLRACRSLRADVCVLPRLHELGSAVPGACLDEVWGIPLIPLRRRAPIGMALKRAFDVAVAGLALAVLSPLMLALGVAVRLQLRRPALFRQVREVGSGRNAEIIKLRTLSGHSDPDTCWVVPVQRCTRLGQFMRATHLDELPQLVNVLRGEMSLVGPRPERPYFARQFASEIPRYRDRQRVPAGMTGLAQAHGLNGDTSIRDRVRFDNHYIEHWSFWLDLVILARTAATLVAGTAGSLTGTRSTSATSASAAGPPPLEASFPSSSRGGTQ